MLETIGRIAAHPARPVPWMSAYCLYDRFCEEDETDETHANALALFSLLLEAMPEREAEINRFRADYLRLRDSFEPEYRALPTAVFQADLNSSNILLDENRVFRGLIDFNLSGSETILNYALVESLIPPADEDELPRLTDPEYLLEKDAQLSSNLSVIARHYAFTKAERLAWPTLYRLACLLSAAPCAPGKEDAVLLRHSPLASVSVLPDGYFPARIRQNRTHP